MFKQLLAALKARSTRQNRTQKSTPIMEKIQKTLERTATSFCAPMVKQFEVEDDQLRLPVNQRY